MNSAPQALGRQSDDVLMTRVQGDDPTAFGELYDRHAAAALGVARSICASSAHAEDVVQEGFLSIWRSRATYEPARGRTFRGWAMQIVRNRAIDSRRQAGVRPRITSGDVKAPPGAATRSAHDEAVERSEHRGLNDALERLPQAQAEVIALAYFGGMSHTQIAEKLHLPRGTVKGRMRLGLEKMRRGLKAG